MAKPIYPLVAGPIPTVLTSAYHNGDTSIKVESVGYIPDAINHVTLRDGEEFFVTLEYTGVSGNTLTGITYVQGDSTHVFPVGTSVCRCFDEYDYDALSENISIKQNKHIGASYAGKILVVNESGNIDTGEAPKTAIWGNITGDIVNQTDLQREFVKEYQGVDNYNRPLVVGDDGDVTLGSRPVTPYVEQETCIFPPGSTVIVENHTVIF